MANFEKKMHEYMRTAIEMCESEDKDIKNEGAYCLNFWSKIYTRKMELSKKKGEER